MKSQEKFAKKSLGQNFLNSTDIRDNILKHAGEISGKNILEIGPGLGFLTEELLDQSAHLTAIDLDDRVIPILKKKFGENENFTLFHGSILDFDLDEHFEQKKYSIIANIPYHITSPILRKILAETKNRPEFALLMVQKEVAEKICPKLKKGKTKRSILSISVEVFADAEICFLVGREYFDPAPKVDSAIIKITPKKIPEISPDLEADFFTVVNAGFHEKRKKLGNSIGKYFGVSPKLLLGDIDPNLRAENLSIDNWVTIAKNFQKNVKNS